MDRERLKEVHQTDLTESRLNQDFLDWLKTSGVTYLLVLMLCLCAYLFYVRWKQSRTNFASEAWSALSEARLPASFEEVATQYENIGAVPHLARIRGAEMLMDAVYTGTAIDAAPEPVADDPTVPPKPAAALTEQDRVDYLRRADLMYQRIVAKDDGSEGLALIISKALCGRAAVAATNGNVEGAQKLYEQAAARVEKRYPELAEAIRTQAQGVASTSAPITLPTEEEIRAAFQKALKPRDPAMPDPMLDEIIAPPETEENGGS